MIKLKSIQFFNHPVLGNLVVDFCDIDGKPVDTILIAGENGTGKSTLLNEIYRIATYAVNSEMIVSCCVGGEDYTLSYHPGESANSWFVKYGLRDDYQLATYFRDRFKFSGIFSDVDINFHTSPITYVTSLDTDRTSDSRRSDGSLTRNIQQLIIDIQNLDDSQLSKKVRSVKGKSITVDDELTSGRMNRFLKAFGIMFETLKYDGIENESASKKIMFMRGDKKINLDNLSSGEKQIVYRGSFMLQDINALTGALVLIDEPEISMHPEWQKKIMQFYKNIFIDENGIQTSQIFAVTHSPFVIHNDLRKNDKVIVLTRGKDDSIVILDKPEYYVCNSKIAIADAFKQEWFQPTGASVYLEGRTDKKYFNKALEVFGYSKLPFEFKWIGHLSQNGQEEFTGKDSLNRAYQFSLSAKYDFKQVFLFDCDVRKEKKENIQSILWSIPEYENERFKAGIENTLEIKDISDEKFNEFYSTKTSKDNYGAIKKNQEFKKMEFCDYICNLDNAQLEKILVNIRMTIEELIVLFK